MDAIADLTRSNCEDAIVCFKKHLLSNSHVEAVEAVVKLPKTTKDVGEQLSRAHRVEEHAGKGHAAADFV